MDQGILFQILWNGLHGHPFESTLSSQLSTNVVHAESCRGWATTAWANTSADLCCCGCP